MRFVKSSFLFFLLFTSCKDYKQFEYLDNICNNKLPINSDSLKANTSEEVKAQNIFLYLSEIKNCSDTFILRIEYSPDTVLRIFEFSYYKSQSSYKIYNYPLVKKGRGQISFDNRKDKLKDITTIFASKDIDKRFIKQFEKSNLINLSNSSFIKGYPNVEYEHYYQVEYSNKCLYKFYTFGGASENRSKFIEARQFSNFLIYLKEEFNF